MMRSGTYHPRLALLICAAAACTSPVEMSKGPPLTGAGPFVVSSPVANGPAAVAAVQGSAGSAQVAFISLPPGALPGGTGASIRVQRTGTVVSAALVDGGLDPVAVPAVAGDTLALTVTQAAGAALVYTFTVPAAAPPILVRTQPPIHKRDVPLNVRLLVVFSEPIAETSLMAQNFVLRSGSGTIAGQLTFANAERTAVVFTPAANLAGATDYELVLRPGIRDDDGRPLEVTASIPFTTGVTIAPAYTLTVTPDSISVPQYGSSTIQVRIYRANFSGAVNLAAQNLPTGVTASFDPVAATGDSSTLTLAVRGGMVAGQYRITVRGSTPSASARDRSGTSGTALPDPTATLTLNVPSESVALSLTPASLSIPQGSSGATTVNIDQTNFAGPVSLLLLAAPIGVNGTFDPNPSTGKSVLTITVGAAEPTGVYVLTVRDSYGYSSIPLTLTVTESSPWVSRAPIPTARLLFGTGVVNGVLYAVGGVADRGYLAETVEAYDPATNTWTTKAPMPTARYNLGVGVLNGVLYAVGGATESGNVGTLEAYDPASNSWTTKAPMPSAQSYVGVGVVNGVLYAVGGCRNGECAPAVQAYDPATDSWSAKAPMPTARGWFGIGVVNGLLYAVGGDVMVPNAGFRQEFGTVEEYDPGTNRWTTKAPMTTARTELGVGVVNGILYAVGGDAVGTVEAYDPATNTWTNGASMLTPQWAASVAVVNRALYAVGGFDTNPLNPSSPFGFVEAYYIP